jgi:hypothetical protein
MSRPNARVARMREQATAVNTSVSQLRDDATAERINHALVAVSRAMVPMDYTPGHRCDHDPALARPPYPVLNVVRQLAALQPGSDHTRFLAGGVRRACNRPAFALDQANAALEGCRGSPERAVGGTPIQSGVFYQASSRWGVRPEGLLIVTCHGVSRGPQN